MRRFYVLAVLCLEMMLEAPGVRGQQLPAPLSPPTLPGRGGRGQETSASRPGGGAPLEAPAVPRAFQVAPPTGPSVRISVSFSPSAPVLGRFDDVSVTFTVTDALGAPILDADLAISTTAGSFEDLRPVGDGRYIAGYTLPSTRHPQVALVAVSERRSPGAGLLFTIPLTGSTSFPVQAPADLPLEFEVAGKTFGPFQAGEDGHAMVKIEVPPGVTRARALARRPQARGKPPVVLEQVLELPAPSFTRIKLLPLPPIAADGLTSRFVQILVLDPAGRPLPGAELALSAALGVVAPPVDRGDGTYLARYTPPRLQEPRVDTLVARLLRAGPEQEERIELQLTTVAPSPPAHTISPADGEAPVPPPERPLQPLEPPGATVAPSAEPGPVASRSGETSSAGAAQPSPSAEAAASVETAASAGPSPSAETAASGEAAASGGPFPSAGPSPSVEAAPSVETVASGEAVPSTRPTPSIDPVLTASRLGEALPVAATETGSTVVPAPAISLPGAPSPAEMGQEGPSAPSPGPESSGETAAKSPQQPAASGGVWTLVPQSGAIQLGFEALAKPSRRDLATGGRLYPLLAAGYYRFEQVPLVEDGTLPAGEQTISAPTFLAGGVGADFWFNAYAGATLRYETAYYSFVGPDGAGEEGDGALKDLKQLLTLDARGRYPFHLSGVRVAAGGRAGISLQDHPSFENGEAGGIRFVSDNTLSLWQLGADVQAFPGDRLELWGHYGLGFHLSRLGQVSQHVELGGLYDLGAGLSLGVVGELWQRHLTATRASDAVRVGRLSDAWAQLWAYVAIQL